MEEFYPEIESLKAAIEKKMGRRLSSPSDFNELVYMIGRDTGGHVGITTVKRLWGYIENGSRLREDTLSVFARFAGYADWQDFCIKLRETSGIESSYLTGRQVVLSDLAEGDSVEIGWLPDRYCLLDYLGNGRFSVAKSVNAKLHVGDTFNASVFCVGQPLYVSCLSPAEGRPSSYVAGLKNGLTLVRKVGKKG